MIFNQIPTTVRTPGSYGEFDSSKARPSNEDKPQRALLIGTKLSGGSMTVETVYEITGGGAQCEGLAGVGSPLAEMGRAFAAANPGAPFSLLASTEPSGGTAASGSLVFTGTSTADGSVFLYVAGELVQVDLLSGSTSAQAATAVYNAINAKTRLPILATNGTPSTTTLAGKWKGVAGNDVLVELNRLETQALPAGLACTVNTMASGAGVPVIATTIAAIPDDVFDRVVSQFNDDATMDALEAWAVTRWNALVQQESVVHAAYRGSYANSASYGAARNSPYSTVAAIELSPTAPWVAGAIYAAVDASELDPARPLNTLALPGVVAPKVSQRFTRTQRDALLHAGMTTTKTVAGVVQIERAITTYQLNASSIVDDTYLDLTTPKTLAYLRWNWNTYLVTTYPRHKLGDDGTPYDPDQPVVTPKVLLGDLLAWADRMGKRALIENVSTFKENARAERNETDPNRADFFAPPDLVNGAHVFATKWGFIL